MEVCTLITELIKVLNEKRWKYSISSNGEFSMILGNEELSCYTWEDDKIQEIIKKVCQW